MGCRTVMGTRGSPIVCVDVGFGLTAIELVQKLRVKHGVAVTIGGLPGVLGTTSLYVAHLCECIAYQRGSSQTDICPTGRTTLAGSYCLVTGTPVPLVQPFWKRVWTCSWTARTRSCCTVYGFGNSGPRGFLANLEPLILLEKILAEKVGCPMGLLCK